MKRFLITIGVFSIIFLLISSITAVPKVNSDSFINLVDDIEQKKNYLENEILIPVKDIKTEGLLDLIVALIQAFINLINALIQIILDIFNLVDLIDFLIQKIIYLFNLIWTLIEWIIGIFTPSLYLSN